MIVKHGHQPRLMPFQMDGVHRTADGVLRYADLPDSLISMLRSSVTEFPDREVLVELGGDRVTYRELWERSARVAGGLRALGVGSGDRVGIYLPNGNDWAYAFFGVLFAGAVVVPINTRLTDAEVAYVVDDSGSKFVFEPGVAMPDGEPYVSEDRNQEDLAAIFYTSGTTGFPKGAMVTHENFLANCENCRRVFEVTDDLVLRNLISVPMFHVTACNAQLLATIHLSGTLVIMPEFEVQTFLGTIVEEQINMVVSVPAIYWLALNQPNFDDFDLSGLRYVTYGGAPIAPDIVARLRQKIPGARLGNGFGLTETSSVATFLPDEYCEIRPESVGFAAPVVEHDLSDVDVDTRVGELRLRGQNVVSGYWNKPEQTEASFVDKWLLTGDLARIDEDGFVQIVDRSKDMVNRGGENVYCVEVENALVGHSDIYEVAVLGVPDVMMGEKVGAVVVVRPGAKPDAQEIRRWALERIADFKVPQYLELRTEPLPRNAGGKVLKAELRANVRWGIELG